MLVPFLLIIGCNLDGGVEYGTPDAALITSFDEVGSVFGSEMMNAMMDADVTFSGTDFTSLKMDVSWTVADDIYTYSGDVIIDGVYYHAEDLM